MRNSWRSETLPSAAVGTSTKQTTPTITDPSMPCPSTAVRSSRQLKQCSWTSQSLQLLRTLVTCAMTSVSESILCSMQCDSVCENDLDMYTKYAFPAPQDSKYWLQLDVILFASDKHENCFSTQSLHQWWAPEWNWKASVLLLISYQVTVDQSTNLCSFQWWMRHVRGEACHRTGSRFLAHLCSND